MVDLKVFDVFTKTHDMDWATSWECGYIVVPDNWPISYRFYEETFDWTFVQGMTFSGYAVVTGSEIELFFANDESEEVAFYGADQVVRVVGFDDNHGTPNAYTAFRGAKDLARQFIEYQRAHEKEMQK